MTIYLLYVIICIRIYYKFGIQRINEEFEDPSEVT